MKIYKRKLLAVFLSVAVGAGGSLSFVHAENNSWQVTQESIDYILGRPMTDEEIAEQEAMVPELHDMPLPDEPAEPIQSEGRARAAASAQVERFDLREKGLVTEVKNQVVDGPCWAFSAIALAESEMMAWGLDPSPDLSEEHLAYFFYNRQNDPLGNTLGDKNIADSGGNLYKSVGGNLQLAGKFLSTWSGAASESLVPYSVSSSVIEDSLAYEAEVHLQNARFIDPSTEELKEALYTGRKPVGITYRHENSYWNKETGAYCYPIGGTGINHAVTIVGWDDSYSKDNFSQASKVEKDGAWIVKNSWGSQSGDGGYIYISYEDKSLQGAVSADFEPADNYDHNYQYDGSSGSSSISVSPGESHANVFQVKGNPSGSEILKAVGILLRSANVDLSIDVYTEVTDPANPSGGMHSIQGQKVSSSYGGYYTFPLEKEIGLREGSYFSVVFTNCSSENKSFSIESAVDSGWIRFETGVESGQSFYRAKDGKTWQDMNGDYLSNGKAVNARIKAYTADHSEPLPSPSPTATATVTAPTETPAETEVPTETPGETARPTVTESPMETETPMETGQPEEMKKPAKVVVSSSVSKKNNITLNWRPAVYAESYEIYRASVSGGNWKRVGTTAKTSYTDKKLSPASGYCYRIRGRKGEGGSLSYGAYSDTHKVLTKPDVPGKISMKVTSRAGKKSKAKITFKISGGASGYEIRQRNQSTGKYEPGYKIQGGKAWIYQKEKKKYKKIGTVGKSGGKLAAVLTKIDLKTRKKQYFKMRAYVDQDGCSRQYSKDSGKIILK